MSGRHEGERRRNGLRVTPLIGVVHQGAVRAAISPAGHSTPRDRSV
jgi:hypothetical protein